ncbi:hypothetical protein [Agrobacterium tumefaciens]|uniref:hypothetical protein n=1 Tax=Agrobacterium tumefaciens TaxID=358 RepID=UPI0015722F00
MTVEAGRRRHAGNRAPSCIKSERLIVMRRKIGLPGAWSDRRARLRLSSRHVLHEPLGRIVIEFAETAHALLRHPESEDEA